MSKNLVISLSAIILLYFGCSKSNNSDSGPKNTTPVKIEIVSGSGQTDTIGRPVANPIVVKITQNGSPLSGYTVQFQGSGCNQDNIVSGVTQSDGTVSFNWWLAGDVGQQTLKVYVLNAQNGKVDSTIATATGLAIGPGWHYSACNILFADAVSAICKISSGRMFACWNGAKAYLRYSDDNGISWNALTSLGNTHTIQYVVSSATDELFVLAGDGAFYSSDGGQTWINQGTTPFGNNISSAISTPSHKLMVTTKAQPLYISSDNGKTWTTYGLSTFPNDNAAIDSPCEDQNGNLYVVGKESGTVYKSTDQGKTWMTIPHVNQLDHSLYIDNNNTFYLSRSEPNTGGIYISKDAGNTYALLTGYSNVFIEKMSVQSDGNFFYEYVGLGLYEAPAISAPVKRIFNYAANYQLTAPYVVAKNSYIVTGDVTTQFIHYLSK